MSKQMSQQEEYGDEEANYEYKESMDHENVNPLNNGGISAPIKAYPNNSTLFASLREHLEASWEKRNAWKLLPVYNHIKQYIEHEENIQQHKFDILALRYATDETLQSTIDLDDIWQSILRDEAWDQKPIQMLLLAAAQLAICMIVGLSGDLFAVNSSTLSIAVCYIVSMFAINKFNITRLFIKYFQSFYNSDQNMELYTSLMLLWPFY